MRAGLRSVAVLALLVAGTTQAQDCGTFEWSRRANNGPSARANHAMSYYSPSGLTLLHGGRGNGPLLGDLWAWNGTSWNALNPSGQKPTARWFHEMVMDESEGVAILFGGQDENNQIMNDTWIWDGSGLWELWGAGRSPSQRWKFAMAYDWARGEVVMFGGQFGDGPLKSDTWIWHSGGGGGWSERTPGGLSPSARNHTAMAFDGNRGTMILYGGADASGKLSDTWEWDGTTWTQLSVSGPGTRVDHQMSWDPNRQRIVLWGGAGAPTCSFPADTWEWDGTQWTQVATAFDGAGRSGHQMVYDTIRQEHLVVAGQNCVSQFVRDTVAGYVVLPPVFNDCCAGAIGVSEGTISFDSTGATDDGSNHPSCGGMIGKDIWYRYVATCDEYLHVSTCGSSFDTMIAVYDGTSCPFGESELIACADDTAGCGTSSELSVPVAFGRTYFIRVGGKSGASGAGLLSIDCSPLDVCPPVGGVGDYEENTYTLTGAGAGTAWSWRIESTAFPAAEVLNVPGVMGTTLEVAQQFADSINDYAATHGCSDKQLRAVASQKNPFPATLAIRVGKSTSSFTLFVGPAGGPANCKVDLTLPACSFNPSIDYLPYAYSDCNHNGWSDFTDILSGRSQDANGNWVPDECERVANPGGLGLGTGGKTQPGLIPLPPPNKK